MGAIINFDCAHPNPGYSIFLIDVAFAGADVVSLFDRKDEHAAVTDFTCSRGFNDGFDHVVDHFILDYELDHDFRKQRHAVFRSPVNRLVTLLPAVAANFGDGHAGDAQLRQRVFDFF